MLVFFQYTVVYTISKKRGLHRLYRQCMQIILRPENTLSVKINLLLLQSGIH